MVVLSTNGFFEAPFTLPCATLSTQSWGQAWNKQELNLAHTMSIYLHLCAETTKHELPTLGRNQLRSCRVEGAATKNNMLVSLVARGQLLWYVEPKRLLLSPQLVGTPTHILIYL